LLMAKWRKDEVFDPEFKQPKTSGNHESKSSFC
jgi:hypothetical protein